VCFVVCFICYCFPPVCDLTLSFSFVSCHFLYFTQVELKMDQLENQSTVILNATSSYDLGLYSHFVLLHTAGLILIVNIIFITILCIGWYKHLLPRKRTLLLLSRSVADIICACSYLLSTLALHLARALFCLFVLEFCLTSISLSVLRLIAVYKPIFYRLTLTPRILICIVACEWMFGVSIAYPVSLAIVDSVMHNNNKHAVITLMTQVLVLTLFILLLACFIATTVLTWQRSGNRPNRLSLRKNTRRLYDRSAASTQRPRSSFGAMCKLLIQLGVVVICFMPFVYLLLFGQHVDTVNNIMYALYLFRLV
jgi:hypothetical protein